MIIWTYLLGYFEGWAYEIVIDTPLIESSSHSSRHRCDRNFLWNRVRSNFGNSDRASNGGSSTAVCSEDRLKDETLFSTQERS
jgi:hypothetical protein